MIIKTSLRNNDNITHHIAESIRANDFSAYQRERYPAIQEGEFVRFTDEDFRSVDFGQFVMGFFVFENCNLDGAKHIYGQPIYFTDSSVRNVDFRGVKAIIEAEDCVSSSYFIPRKSQSSASIIAFTPQKSTFRTDELVK